MTDTKAVHHITDHAFEPRHRPKFKTISGLWTKVRGINPYLCQICGLAEAAHVKR
jgi:hypothetical protein